MIFSRTNLRISQSRAKNCEESAGNVRFDIALQKMASLRDKGILQLPTVSQFMKHQENLKLVTYRIEKNTVIIHNRGNDIKGLTLVIKKNDLPQKFY